MEHAGLAAGSFQETKVQIMQDEPNGNISVERPISRQRAFQKGREDQVDQATNQLVTLVMEGATEKPGSFCTYQHRFLSIAARNHQG